MHTRVRACREGTDMEVRKGGNDQNGVGRTESFDGADYAGDSMGASNDGGHTTTAAIAQTSGVMMNALLRTARMVVGSIASAVIYVPFCFAVLLQSAADRRGVNTDNWKQEVSRAAWIAGTVGFLILFQFAISIPVGFAASHQLQDSDNVTQILAVSRSAISVFLAILIIIQCLTVFYAIKRKDLRRVRTILLRPKLSVFNILPALSVVFEVFQFGALFVESGRISSAFRDVFGAFLFQNGDGGDEASSVRFRVFFWISATVVVVYSLLLGIFIVLALPLNHPLSPLVFSFLSGTLYITVTSTVMGAIDCVSSDDGLLVVLTKDLRMQCWSAGHVPFAVTAFLSLLFYSSTAIFVASYKGERSSKRVQVRFAPRFQCIERTLKNIFVVVAVLVKTPDASFPVAIALVVSLLVANVMMQPCSYPVLNHCRTLTLSGVVWLGLVGLLAEEVPQSKMGSGAILALLFAGWGVLAAAGIVFAWSGRCMSRKVTRAFKAATAASVIVANTDEQSGFRASLDSNDTSDDDSDYDTPRARESTNVPEVQTGRDVTVASVIEVSVDATGEERKWRTEVGDDSEDTGGRLLQENVFIDGDAEKPPPLGLNAHAAVLARVGVHSDHFGKTRRVRQGSGRRNRTPSGMVVSCVSIPGMDMGDPSVPDADEARALLLEDGTRAMGYGTSAN